MKHLHSVDYNKLDEEMCKNPHFRSIEYNLTVGFLLQRHLYQPLKHARTSWRVFDVCSAAAGGQDGHGFCVTELQSISFL